MNTTHICRIIAVYRPNPLKALQTTSLLDSPHRVIDPFLSLKRSGSGFVQSAERRAKGTFSLPLAQVLLDIALLYCFWQGNSGVFAISTPGLNRSWGLLQILLCPS